LRGLALVFVVDLIVDLVVDLVVDIDGDGDVNLGGPR